MKTYHKLLPFVLINLCLVPLAFANEYIQVQGSSTVFVEVNQVTIDFSIRTIDPAAGKAQKDNAKIASKVIKSIKRNFSLKSRDIQTTNFALNPQYRYERNKQVFKGFEVRNSLRVTLKDNKKIGSFLDTLTKNGVNNIGQIRFGNSNSAKFKEEAMEKAFDDAKTKAKKLAKRAGVMLSKVKMINYQSASHHPQPVMAMAKMESAQSVTPVETGVLGISANVNVKFEIK